jgi:hypothetical protein
MAKLLLEYIFLNRATYNSQGKKIKNRSRQFVLFPKKKIPIKHSEISMAMHTKLTNLTCRNLPENRFGFENLFQNRDYT